MPDAPPFSPAQLEAMRTMGLRLDVQGRIWHQDVEVSHPRLRRALLGWLDVLPDGRDVVRLDDKRYAYIDLEPGAYHLRAAGARWDADDACWLTWDDGGVDEELPYIAITIAADNALQVPARAGRLRGRIGGAAYQTVTERLEQLAGGTFGLRARGQTWPLAQRR